MPPAKAERRMGKTIVGKPVEGIEPGDLTSYLFTWTFCPFCTETDVVVEVGKGEGATVGEIFPDKKPGFFRLILPVNMATKTTTTTKPKINEITLFKPLYI